MDIKARQKLAELEERLEALAGRGRADPDAVYTPLDLEDDQPSTAVDLAVLALSTLSTLVREAIQAWKQPAPVDKGLEAKLAALEARVVTRVSGVESRGDGWDGAAKRHAQNIRDLQRQVETLSTREAEAQRRLYDLERRFEKEDPEIDIPG